MNIQTPAARNTDPQSSHVAAEKVTLSGVRANQQIAVLRLVKKYPGSTSAELAAKTTKLDRYQIARRLPELQGAVITKGKPKHCSKSNQACDTWWPKATGSNQ